MKYLPLREFEIVTSALNFYTADCRVVGGCDLYTTKAAGDDKKLYKIIENSLEAQHESLVRFSKSLSPPNAELFSINLSRPSPFGPLSEVSARRTFAYLIATLNATHPDYDFSHLLRPSDFRREPSLKSVMLAVDDSLYNVRRRPVAALLAPPTSNNAPALISSYTPGGSQAWSPLMWKLIDKEMKLHECDIYLYSPDEDPFDGDENAIWSLHYFFFNKQLKRVVYLYLRGLSIPSHSPARVLTVPGGAKIKAKRPRPISRSLSIEAKGATKRAKYWLGDGADRAISEGEWKRSTADTYEYTDRGKTDVDVIADHPGDDEVDVEDFRESRGVSSAYVSESEGEEYDDGNDDDDNDNDNDDDDDDEGDDNALHELQTSIRGRDRVRRMSEHIAESMEV